MIPTVGRMGLALINLAARLSDKPALCAVKIDGTLRLGRAAALDATHTVVTFDKLGTSVVVAGPGLPSKVEFVGVVAWVSRTL